MDIDITHRNASLTDGFVSQDLIVRDLELPPPYLDLCLPMYPGVVLSERIWLRPYFPEDWSAVEDCFQDPDNMRYFGYGRPLSSEMIQTRIQASALANLSDPVPSGWLILTHQGPAGCFWARPSHECPLEVELAYCLHPRFAGQGITTEAGKAVISRFLSPPAFTGIIFATVHPDNKASQGVIRKLGLKPDPERQGVPKYNSLRNYYVKSVSEELENPLTWAFGRVTPKTDIIEPEPLLNELEKGETNQLSPPK